MRHIVSCIHVSLFVLLGCSSAPGKNRDLALPSLGATPQSQPPRAPAPVTSAEPSAEDRLALVAQQTSDPNLRSDALLRLAILISDREGAIKSANLAERLGHPIAILRQIPRENPQYAYLFQVEYELACDLMDAGRFAEAAQVFRSIVCRDRYPYPVPTDPKNPERDDLMALPQDHPAAFWATWASSHENPSSVAKPSNDPAREEVFRDPYPSSCAPMSSEKLNGSSVAEIWLRIAQTHFDLVFPEDGPYALNRARSALERSLTAASTVGSGASEEMRARARYLLSWTDYKQQRYEASARGFIATLELQAGKDYDDEALTYLAGSLTMLDFVGPRPTEPYIARPDVLDTERSPQVAEKKLAIGLTRIATASLVPQDQPWTPSAYLALAHEYEQLLQFDNAERAYTLYLDKWPFDDGALQARFDAASSWERVGRMDRKRADTQKKALKGFAELAKQGSPGGAWYEAHKDDPKVLAAAADLVSAAQRRLGSPP